MQKLLLPIFAVALAGPACFAQAATSAAVPDRAQAYYHYGLSHIDEDMVTNFSRPESATQAIEEYKLALQADPDSQQLNTGLAELYFKLGRVRDAVMEAQDLVRRDPNNLEAHKLLGRIYIRSLGDMDQGQQSDDMLHQTIKEYEQIVRLEPNSVEDHLLLGRLYTADHDDLKAKAQFEAAHKIEPASEDAVLNLARIYAQQGQMKEATELLEAVPAENRTPKLELALGGLYDQQADTKKAIAAYRASLALEPDDLDAERSLAQDLLATNDMDAAMKIYEGIAAADPQDPMAFLRMSEIDRRRGDYDDALAQLKKAKALASDSMEVTYNESLIDDSLGQLDDAAAALEKLCAATFHADGQYTDAEKSNRTLFLDRLANVYREQNKTDEAIATYKKMMDLSPELAVRAWQFCIETYAEAHQQARALQAAQDAVAKFPSKIDLKLALAGQLADSGQVEAGLKLAKDQLNGSATDRDVYLQLAHMDTRLHRYAEATQQLDLAAKTAKTPEEKIFLDYYRGENFDRQKQTAQAEQQFRAILAIDPANAMAMNYLGFMFAENDIKLDEALALVKKAVELDPQNGAYLDSLGWVYFKQGKLQEAEQQLQQAVLRQPVDPSLHDHLGQIYDRQGHLKLAAQQWEIALKLYRASNPADYDAADLSKLEKNLESARVRLARNETEAGAAKP